MFVLFMCSQNIEDKTEKRDYMFLQDAVMLLTETILSQGARYNTSLQNTITFFSFHNFPYMKILYVFYHYVFSFHRFSLMVPLLHVCRGSVMRCPLSHSLMITDTCELQIWYFVKFWHHPHSFSGSGRLTSLLTETSRYYAMSPNHSNVNFQN